MQENKRKHASLKVAVLLILALAFAAGWIYSHFGGFGTGESADTEAFAKYAGEVSTLTVPEGAQIVALGEATHGNAEFQQLRLEVLQRLVTCGVRSIALEADFGGCEAVNRYICGGAGSAREAAAALGFAIYRTGQTEELIEWMRGYNESAAPGEELRFYGFDMQRYAYSYRYLLEAAQAAGLDTSELEALWDEDTQAYSSDVTGQQREEAFRAVQAQLPEQDDVARHFADILLQNRALGQYLDDPGALNEQRDRMMADNVLWILRQEQARGSRRILICGHNNHVKRTAQSGAMGSLLAGELGSGYFVIGTDFYKSSCNLPNGSAGERLHHTFYSRDPLAKASMICGFSESYLDFSAVPADSPLSAQVRGEIWMGSLGELYNGLMMRLLPRSYRILAVPAEAYDAMIFVTEATPTDIKMDKGES